ncbi:uncharacterized protein N7479_002508 [Penicillium vulpinum]|uniref:uncharacterized protein n=1 Tax=Penicillium vulpinum TaxID=29845 RepID=UPI002547789C|nr:uncharacterized protein N7479_002508 [Penicillium vulpinum]KAJ5972590.1 hypothetical protein N7479_002508 [Penicillium vulpinum]
MELTDIDSWGGVLKWANPQFLPADPTIAGRPRSQLPAARKSVEKTRSGRRGGRVYTVRSVPSNSTPIPTPQTNSLFTIILPNAVVGMSHLPPTKDQGLQLQISLGAFFSDPSCSVMDDGRPVPTANALGGMPAMDLLPHRQLPLR